MNLKLVAYVMIMLTLAGCGIHISGEIYLADVEELSEDDGLTTAVVMGFPFIETEVCETEQQRYEGVIRKTTGFKDMTFLRCYTSDYVNFVEFEMTVPLRIAEPESETMNGTFEFVRHTHEDTGDVHLYVRSMPSALCNLDKVVTDEFWQPLDLSEIAPRFVITNDLREPQTIVVEQVFVDSKPAVKPTEIVLSRRDSVEVVLSDVTAAHLFSKSCSLSSRAALVAVWSANG